MRIGIGGYMGAGKSTCARALASDRVAVIDADARAKEFMAGSGRIRDKLRGIFGESVIDERGGLSFDVLGKLAFASASSLRAFNDAVHPPLVAHLERLVFGCDKRACILDAALIPLWGAVERWFDLRVWVDAPFDERYRRLRAARVNMDDAELIRRMRLQEEVMRVPDNDHWIKLPDTECQAYIFERLKLSVPDIRPAPTPCRSVSKC